MLMGVENRDLVNSLLERLHAVTTFVCACLRAN
jgi:hypothetical protein